MKRHVLGPRTRFCFVEHDGSEAGDFEIERRAPGGNLIAVSLEHGSPRTFTLLELRQAIAEQRLFFHLEGRPAQPSAKGKASISPREPDFSALPARERDIARYRFEAIRPLIGKADRSAADVRQRAESVAQADPDKRRKNAGSSVSERTLWTWLCWYDDAGDIRGLLPHSGARGRPSKSDELHEIIADRLEARWLQRPPWPLTDVALEVVAEVERRNHDRPVAEHIPVQRTAAGQVRLRTLERMVQRQAQRIDAGLRIAAQRGQTASRAHWDPNVGELRVDRLLDRVDYDAVRLPVLVVDEEHRLVIGRPWFVFGIERKSGMPHGYFLSWEPPNYRSVLECLLFGILPKQALNVRFPSLRGTWECEGLPRAVAIDNGPEFANRHLDDAARQVDFDLLPCPVRVPWFKGIVEGFSPV